MPPSALRGRADESALVARELYGVSQVASPVAVASWRRPWWTAHSATGGRGWAPILRRPVVLPYSKAAPNSAPEPAPFVTVLGDDSW